MSTFTYDQDIPNPSHNPSTDVTTMQTNAQAISGIFDEDHVGFNVANGGYHDQVHLPSFTSPSVVSGSGTEGSVLYTAAGTAAPAVADLFFKNTNGTYRPNIVKAAGSFVGQAANGAVPIISGYNVSSIAKTTPVGAVYTVTLTSGAVTGTTAIVLSSITPQNTIQTVSMSGANTLTFTFSNVGGGDSSQFSFAILQV